MESGKLALHHVGGRWGNVSFSAPASFERDLLHVIYEADDNAMAAINAARENQISQSLVVNACLAETPGEASLQITVDPGASSLRELTPPEKNSAGYMSIAGIDFDGAGLEVVERRRMKTATLDDLVRGGPERPGLPPPDFLSLDTQGTEYEILRGAHHALSTVCGVIAETLFAQAYIGQKRFQDIYDLLDSEGFAFVRWGHIYEVNGPRAAIGLRGQGCQAFGDALFLRRPWTIGEQSKAQLKKLCFISAVYGHLEYSVSCLDRLTSGDFELSPQNAYEEFLAALHRAYMQSSKVMPPALKEILPRDRIGAFAAATAGEWPQLFDFSSFTQPQYLAELHSLQDPQPTEIESVLRQHGFDALADNVYSKRLDQAAKVEKLITDFVRARGVGLPSAQS